MSEQRDIFLSYSHSDAEIATELAARLEDAGLTCFVAERDISATHQWEPRIRNALRAAQCILILLTPRSKDSTWVAIEAGAAWVLEMDIIPATMFIDIADMAEPITKFQARPVETDAQRTTLIQELQKQLLPSSSTSKPPTEKKDPLPLKNELFNERTNWESLQKIGSWQIDDKSHIFSGEGVHRYLLSHHVYGHRSFRISTRIQFSSLSPLNETAAVNAGIIFGWRSSGNVRRYFHLMFTGSEVLLELVGDRGGPVHQDFQHIHTSVPFHLDSERWYDLEIQVCSTQLNLRVNGKVTYTAPIGVNIEGRVGIRPWRSKLKSNHFLIEEA